MKGNRRALTLLRRATHQDMPEALPHMVAEIIGFTLPTQPSAERRSS